jgi:nitrilase
MIKVASIQMVSDSDLAKNLMTAQELIQEAADQNCQIAVLPEYFCLFGKKDRDKLEIQERFGDGLIQDTLRQWAKDHQICIVAGTIPISTNDPDRVLNSSLVFDRQGQIISHYDKIHLFSFSSGGESYDESRTLTAGKELTQFEVIHENESWRFGLSICYDLRFPEMYRAMGEVDCHLLPAAFTYTTGKVHWEILLRARAIENQCYVIASAQGGLHNNGRQTWGHSMVVNPWGAINVVLEKDQGLIIGELHKNELLEVRNKLPALKHRTFNQISSI